jgi:hypothetical protein
VVDSWGRNVCESSADEGLPMEKLRPETKLSASEITRLDAMIVGHSDFHLFAERSNP